MIFKNYVEQFHHSHSGACGVCKEPPKADTVMVKQIANIDKGCNKKTRPPEKFKCS